MKVITVIQPWATLIAIGEKKFETRSWATKHRGPLAIHAGKKIDREACMQEPIRSVLIKHGYTAKNLPTGVIVATTKINDCLKVSRPSGENGSVWLEGLRAIGWGGAKGQEYYFGDYSDGRYAWELTDVQQLMEPIPAKGQQGFWNYPVGG